MQNKEQKRHEERARTTDMKARNIEASTLLLASSGCSTTPRGGNSIPGASASGLLELLALPLLHNVRMTPLRGASPTSVLGAGAIFDELGARGRMRRIGCGCEVVAGDAASATSRSRREGRVVAPEA